MADGSAHDLWICEETTAYGQVNANPVWTPVRHNGCSIGLQKESFSSNEIRSDRQITSHRSGGKSALGDIPVDLSYGSFDNLLEAVLCGNWAANTPIVGTDQLKAGTTRRSFSLMRHFTDIPDKPYLVYTGIEFDRVNFDINPNGVITASFSVIGQDMAVPSATPPAGSTYGSPSTTEPFDAFTGIVKENDIQLSIMTQVAVTLSNGMSARKVIGQQVGLRPSIGRSNATGNITNYFENMTLFEKYVNETETSAEVVLTDAAGNAMTIKLPAGKYTGGNPDVSGEGAILLSMPMQFYRDPTSGTNIIIERNPV